MNWIARVFEQWYCAAHGFWYPESHFSGSCVKTR